MSSYLLSILFTSSYNCVYKDLRSITSTHLSAGSISLDPEVSWSCWPSMSWLTLSTPVVGSLGQPRNIDRLLWSQPPDSLAPYRKKNDKQSSCSFVMQL